MEGNDNDQFKIELKSKYNKKFTNSGENASYKAYLL